MQIIKRLQEDKLFLDVSIFSIASFVASTLNLVYQLAMVRLLGAQDFPQLSAILSLLVIISVPATSFTTMVAKFASNFHAQKKEEDIKFLFSRLFFHSLIAAFIFFAVLNIFRVQFKNYLHLNSLTPIFIFSCLVFLNFILPMLTGCLQGLKKFGWMSIGALVNGLSRLVFAALFVWLGWGLTGALNGFLISLILTIVVSLFAIRKYLSVNTKARFDLRPIYKYIIPVAGTYLCFMSLTNIDMVLVQHYFVNSEFYAVAQIIGKIVLFLPGAIAIVMFPHVSGSHAKGEEHLHIFQKSLKYTAILCVVAVMGFNLMPNFILKVLTGKFGPEYVSLSRLFSITMAFFALNQLMFLYQLSINNFSFLKSLIALTLLQVLLIILIHPTMFSVLGIMLFISLAIFAVNFKFIFAKNAE